MSIWSAERRELDKLFSLIKGKHPKLENELQSLLKTDDANIVLVYSRRCLEVIITDLCERELKRHRGTEPLQRIIDKLNKEEIVPHNIVVSMLNVNSMSTFGAHPKEFELKQVKPVLLNFTTILEWYLKYLESLTPKEISTEKVLLTPVSQKYSRKKYPSRKIIVFGFVGIILVLTLIVFIPKLIQKMIPEASAGEIVRKAIAVLPVSNLTGNPKLEYIADVFQDDLIGKFGAISGLTVRPTPSTLQFKDSKETPQQMAEKLSVNNMIQSSIKGSEENLQVEVRLIEAFPEERYIWNHSYKLSWDSIGNIYNEILNHIIDIINVKPNSQEAKNLSIIKKHNPDLLKACALGRYYVNRLTHADFDRGLKYYNDAIAIDPTDPLPYLGLALAYSSAGHVSNVAADAYNRAIGYARQAIAIDSTSPESADAYVVLASKLLYTDWNFPETERLLKHAMKLNPNNPMAYYHYGWYLMLSNDVEGIVAAYKRSIEIDPTNAFFTANFAGFYYWIGRPKEAQSEAEKALQLDPNNTLAFLSLGYAYTELGMYEKAIDAHKKGISISPDFEGDLGVTYARMGQREKAVEIATKLEKTNNSWYTYQIAAIYATLGDNDKAIYWIDEAYKNRHDFTPWFKYYVYYKPLHNDSRFQEIIQRLNLPD